MSVREKDPKYAEMAASVKTMLNTNSFDSLLGPKVPMPTAGSIINFLKVNNLSDADYTQYRKMGIDLEKIVSTKANVSLEKEYQNELRTNLIEFKFLAFKSSLKPTSV